MLENSYYRKKKCSHMKFHCAINPIYAKLLISKVECPMT